MNIKSWKCDRSKVLYFCLCTILVPRDAMRKLGHSLLSCGACLSVRPSVRLSVTLVYCIHATEDIVKLLVRPGSPITLVSSPPCADRQFHGEPLQLGTKYKGWENFAIFDGNHRISRKRYNYEIGPWLLWNFNRKS